MSKRFSRTVVVLVACVGILAGALATVFSYSNGVYADTAAETEVLKKALLNGLQKCYNDTYMKKTITGVDYTGIYSLMTSKAFGTDGHTDGTVKVPNNVGNTLSDADISCEQLFTGYNQNKSSNSVRGLNSLYGKSPTLANLGYVRDTSNTSSASQSCVWYEYSYGNSGITTTGRTEQICFQVTDGEVENINDSLVTVNEDATAGYGGKTGPVSLLYKYGEYSLSLYTNTSTYTSETIVLGANPTWNELLAKLRDDAKRIDNAQDGNEFDGWYQPYSGAKLSSSVTGGEVYDNYQRSATAALTALRYYTGNSTATWTSDIVTFNSKDVYTLYSSYFNQMAKAHPQVLSRAADDKCTATNTYTYAIYNGSKWCEVSGVENISETFNGVNMSGDHWTGLVGGVSFSTIVKTLGQLNYDVIENEGGVVGGLEGITIDNGGSNNNGGGGTSGGNDSSSGDDAGLLDGCMSNAGVLGWILCPVIRLIGGAIEGVYSGIEGLLMVDANTVTDPATRSAWSQFQGYANIVFAIVLAIVIISQVTGIGLNNYNIKKILPRLIITIVLVNLSFIICSIAIDLSNILGVRLKDLFDGLHVVNQGIFDVDPGAFVRNTLESLLEVGPIVLGAGVAISVIMTAELWKMMILPLLLGFIVMLISILFFFIILGVRQAAIIILLVVSPIAIICYTLPNTQKVFDRWLKMFSSLLIVYPICGLMMGGGQFMSRLLLNAGGSGMSFMYYLTAMLLSVVPFFFIPTILKGSLTAMGNLGLKLSQMGSRVSSGVARSIRGSDWAREYQRDQALSQSRGAYERLNRREQAIKDAGGRGLNARDARRRSRYARQMLRLEAEDRRAGYNPAQVEAARRHQLIQQQNDDISGRQDLYRGGSMSSIIAGHTDPINGNNNDELADELDAYMDRIVTGQTADGRTLTQDEINDDVMNAQALINTLADQGTSGARAKVEQSFARAMHRHQSIFGDPDQGGRLSHTFGSLAARTNAKYGKDFKKDSPGAAAMLGDIAQGSFTRAGTFSDSGRVETRHADTDHERKMSILRSSYYGGSGAGVSGMSTEDFSKLKAYGANNILDGLRAGQITGSNARAAARMADEVLNSGVYTPDSDVRDILEQIRTAGYSAGGDLNGRSTGSLALSGASTSALESVVSDVSGIADSAAWESLSDAERKNYRQLFNNIRETLDNDTLSAANADQLQQALKIAHDRGFTDASGNVIGAFSGTPHLKIDHSATQPIVVPPVPQGWTEGGMWTGGGSGPSKQQEIAYQEWAKIKARADMQNNGGNP